MEIIGLIALGWIVGLWVLMLVAAGEVAKVRGRSFGNWACLGLMYGIIAVVVVYLMPPLEPKTTPAASRSGASPAPQIPSSRR